MRKVAALTPWCIFPATRRGRKWLGKRLSLLCLGCLLLSAALASAEEVGGTDWFEAGKQYFKNRAFGKAADALHKALEQDPANPEVNFYLGRAAFEKGDYETAVMAFERILIMRPSSPRAKLEMARSYMQLGAHETARKYLTEVLEADPPGTVRASIENLLATIDRTQKRHFFHGMVALGSGWDDNVRAAPSEERIQTALGGLVLTGEGARPQGDRIDTTTLVLDYAYRFANSPLSWLAKGVNYNAFYRDQDDLDLSFLSLETGPAYRFSKGMFKVYGLFDYLVLDYDRQLETWGAGASVSAETHPSLLLTLAAEVTKKCFFQIPAKDATNVSLALDSTLNLKGNRLSATFSIEAENAKREENSYDRFNVGVRYDRQLPFGLSIFADIRYQYTDYDDEAFPFDKERTDRLSEASLGLDKLLWRGTDPRYALSALLNHSHTEADSNLDLYEYDKDVTALSLAFQF